MSRSRTIEAEPEAVWRVVSDPYHLPRWWPGVVRVEEASPEAWTKVLSSPKRKSVRADFSRVRFEPPRRLAWRQEVEESPFERILTEAETEVYLEPVDDRATEVELRSRTRLRGLSRFGFVQVRRAAARQLEEALAGLERAAGARG